MLSVETDEHTHVTGTTYTATKNYSIHTLLQFILGNLADNGIIKQHVIQTTFYVTFFFVFLMSLVKHVLVIQ